MVSLGYDTKNRFLRVYVFCIISLEGRWQCLFLLDETGRPGGLTDLTK